MNALHPSTQVLLAVPPHPPRAISLAEIAAARWAAHIPPTATVQVSPDDPWLPVDQVLFRAGLIISATSTRPLLVGLLVVPAVWTLVHQVLFKGGTIFLLVLWAACAGLAIWASSSATLRTKTSSELFAQVRKRSLVWRGMIAAVVVCELLALGGAALRSMRKAHAEEAFAAANDCDFVGKWDKLTGAELDTVEPEQAFQAAARRARCEEQRQKEAAEAYAKRCTEAAARIQGGALSAEDRAFVVMGIPDGNEAYASGEEAGELAARIANRYLKPVDLGGMKSLPCGPAMRHAFLEAVASSATTWASLTRAGDVGDDVLDALGAEPLEKGKTIPKAEVRLTDEARAALHKNAEDTASKMKNPKTSSDAYVPVGLCILERRLGGTPGPACSSLASTVLRLKNAEQLAEKAADARCKTALANRQRCMRACDARQPQDDLGMPAGDFDQSLDCYERCEKTYPANGCD